MVRRRGALTLQRREVDQRFQTRHAFPAHRQTWMTWERLQRGDERKPLRERREPAAAPTCRRLCYHSILGAKTASFAAERVAFAALLFDLQNQLDPIRISNSILEFESVQLQQNDPWDGARYLGTVYSRRV